MVQSHILFHIKVNLVFIAILNLKIETQQELLIFDNLDKMNIKDLHTQEKPISAISLFKSEFGNATAIKILQGETLKEHITKTPALLICMEGKAVFENEKGIKETLLVGDFVAIEPMVKHWVEGIIESQLILIK
jgi:quercetin dioxygenase-like cupin family protein